MGVVEQRVFGQMLERLHASLTNGPTLNCRPGRSRQRLGFSLLSSLGERSPGDMLRELVEARRPVLLQVPPMPPPALGASVEEIEESKLLAANRKKLLNKLRVIAEDAKGHVQETGHHALAIGLPLLSLPREATGSRVLSRRVLAPGALPDQSHRDPRQVHDDPH